MQANNTYPVGRPGIPWDDTERNQWRARQSRQRSYESDVLARVQRLASRFNVAQYGAVSYGTDNYPLFAVRSSPWTANLPTALITGGVHGYETSGVVGALQFLDTAVQEYAGRINLLVVPCVSPWGYERICRWNHDAVDPNRSFGRSGLAAEADAVLALVKPLLGTFLLHVDLHETTDTDASEFTPALAARDGKSFEREGIPDGFYLVGDTVNSQPEFQSAIIAAVGRVTHIAPPDENGKILGAVPIVPGVVEFTTGESGFCSSITGARYTTTTEVYPDSPRTNPQQCADAQVVAVRAALDYALAHA